MLLRLSIAARNRGYDGLADFLWALDCTLSGLGRTARRIKREQKRRQTCPPVASWMREADIDA